MAKYKYHGAAKPKPKPGAKPIPKKPEPEADPEIAAKAALEAKVKAGLAAAFAKQADTRKAVYYEKQAAKNTKMAKAVVGTSAQDRKSRATHKRVAKEYVAKARKLRGAK